MPAIRLSFLGLVVVLSGLLMALGAHAIAPDGWTGLRLALFGCLCVNAPWLALSAATGLCGFAIRMCARDPVAFVLPQLGWPVPAGPGPRTALAVCVRNEAVGPVEERLVRLWDEVAAAGRTEGYVLCVLSDTDDAALGLAEERMVASLRAAGAAVLYRRRTDNAGFKAGNVMSFLDAHAGEFELMLGLDADSTMALATIERMLRVMRADPGLAILQATFHGQIEGAESRFSRLFGFGHRHGLRVWATGQAWWQGDAGPYWGHNALVRVAPFRAHCRLDALPDGRLIMSHDHVEAARLQAAGWRLRVLADDAGSAESHPPTLPDYLGRDVRWAAGNLQYRFLLRRRDLGALGRLQMLQAILHYVLTPFWFAMLPLAAANVLAGGGDVPRGPVLALLLTGWLMLHGPKLLGYAEAVLRPVRVGLAVGRGRFVAACMAELAYTALLDPIIAAHKSWAVLRLAAGQAVGWSGQARGARRVTWGEAVRWFWPHTVAGCVLLVAFGAPSRFALAASAPFVAGLVVAIPLAVWTSRTAGGRTAGRTAGLARGSVAGVGGAGHCREAEPCPVS